MKSLLDFRSELEEGVQSSADIEYTLVNKGGKGVFQKHRARRIVHGGYDTDGGAKSVVTSDQESINKEFYKKIEKQPDIAVKKFQNINKVLNRSKIENKRREVQHPQQQKVTENVAFSVQDPPPVLVLKRQTIRLFNDGIKVALYYSQTLNKYFSVAVGQSANYQAEETDYFTDVLNSDFITHIDNTTTEITEEDKTSLIELYNSLSEDNQLKMQEKILESSEEFLKIKYFAEQIK